MKATMYTSCIAVLCIMASATAGQAQFRHAAATTPPATYTLPATPVPASTSFLPGLRADVPRQFKPSGLVQMPININRPQSSAYWLGSITTQSYNSGKIGRFYYWDLQGNLRESSLFFDIAGKGKRGLKLVFPRQFLHF